MSGVERESSNLVRRVPENTLPLIAILIFSGLLAGCGTIDNRAGASRLPPTALTSSDVGVALFSVGAPDRCISTATFVNIFDEATRKSVKHPPIGVDAYVHTSEFSDHHGLVNAISLPAGKYYFAPWIANPYVSSTQIPTFHFEIVAGESQYLGELFMTESCSTTGYFRIEDHFERDRKIALARNPALGERPIQTRLMKVGEPITRK